MLTKNTNKSLLWFVAIIFYATATQTFSCLNTSSQHEPARTINGACNRRQVDGDKDKIICVCNEQQSHRLVFHWPQQSGQVKLIESTISGKRFDVSELVADQNSSSSNSHTKIIVDLNQKFQTILGWGGAFTDATGENLRSLSKDLADEIIESYFGTDGLQYNIGRVPIGGTDFSARAYSYVDTGEPDYELAKWKLAEEDLNFKIPYIKQALQVAQQAGTQVKLFASPWTPPRWMKTSNNFVRGFLKDDDKIYTSYTNYLMKFYDSYQQHGINFWGATVQNEPMAAFLPVYFFNSMQIGNRQMIKFITKYLGPALNKRGWNKDNFKLMIGDDSLGFINYQVPTVMRDPEVQKYISGLAFHWYTSGLLVPYDALNSVYNNIKDNIEFVMMTEACTGYKPQDKKVDLGSWDRGEAYALDIIEDLLRHTSSWIDWNMALDLGGGPNWSKNFVDSPIVVNATANEFYKQPMYYALAHFSRFFKPGSIRVSSVIESGSRAGLKTIAVHDSQNGSMIVNILNRSRQTKTIDVVVNGSDDSKSSFNIKTFTIEGNSFNTIVLKL